MSWRTTVSIRPSSTSDCSRGGVFIGAVRAEPRRLQRSRQSADGALGKGSSPRAEAAPALAHLRQRTLALELALDAVVELAAQRVHRLDMPVDAGEAQIEPQPQGT